jgi:hypothetical protein
MARKATRKKTSGKRTAAKKTPAKKSAAKKSAKKTTRKAARRERIDTGTDQRLVRRGAAGRFKESDDVGKAEATDQRRKARTKAKRGQGDKGDR